LRPLLTEAESSACVWVAPISSLRVCKGVCGGHENSVKPHEFGGLYFHLKKCAHRAQQN